MKKLEQLTEFQLNNLYNEWWHARTLDECKLHNTILEYENEYFEDMNLEENSLCWNIAAFSYSEFDCPFLNLESNYYRYYIVNDSSDFNGCCYSLEHKIEITKPNVENKAVILHEMIHAHESIIQEKNPIFFEFLLLQLYNKLALLINDLDTRIIEHSELYGQNQISHSGGYHGILFYLKSLDLDLRCKYPLGTVCSYGRDTGEMWY